MIACQLPNAQREERADLRLSPRRMLTRERQEGVIRIGVHERFDVPGSIRFDSLRSKPANGGLVGNCGVGERSCGW
jgi:hypothetical protein